MNEQLKFQSKIESTYNGNRGTYYSNDCYITYLKRNIVEHEIRGWEQPVCKPKRVKKCNPTLLLILCII